MPKYTVETTYRLPVYRQRTYDAAIPTDACRLALADEGWGDAKEDVETSGETYITGIWEGADAAYTGPAVDVPTGFNETVQRKADLFEEFVALLREPGRVMGLSRDQFADWLPRALTVIAKVDAILADGAEQQS